MKIYIVVGEIDYEGYTILSCWQTIEAAQSELETLKTYPNVSHLHYDSYDILTLELGKSARTENL